MERIFLILSGTYYMRVCVRERDREIEREGEREREKEIIERNIC